ncbi:MAG: 4-hydroxy-2-ketovalerate aldolase, partial [Lachnospiraceae bacterium]
VTKKGYKFILNPVNVMGYTTEKLRELLTIINELQPFGVTIVDTFGSMQVADLERLYKIFEEVLNSNITIGLHLHENMSSSFLLAQHFLKIKKSERKVTIDGSLLGMGRIPGNLCIEMLMDYMNSTFQSNYQLEPILRTITKYIEPIKEKKAWGYSPAYYFTGKLCIHRSYAEFLLAKNDIDLGDILCILAMLENDSHKTSFSKEYAQQLYVQYMYTKEG